METFDKLSRYHLIFKHPCTALVAGPTRPGKILLMRDILKNFEDYFHKNRYIESFMVFWYISKCVH